MRKDKAPGFVERWPGGFYNKSEFYSIIRVSFTHGEELIKQYPDEIPVIYLEPSSPRISDDVVERILREGLPGARSFRREVKGGAVVAIKRGRGRPRTRPQKHTGEAAR